MAIQENMDASDGLIENGNIKILYVTLIIMVGILLLWIIIIVMSKRNCENIISEINKLSAQIADVDDSVS